MKELSTEEKAKRYDEALLKAKEQYDNYSNPALLEYIFPELKENKGEWIEKIRQELKTYLEHREVKHISESDAILQWIDWLEKQGNNSTSIDIDKMVMKYSQTKDGDFGLPVNCMIRAYRQGINDALNLSSCIEKQGESKPADEVEPKDYNAIDPHFGKPIDKVEPKFHEGEWSKEDENNILFLTSIIEECFKDKEKITLCADTVCANFTKEDVIDRLESLKDRVQPQPKQEWSEEDDQYLLVCKNALAKYQASDKWDAKIISRWLENKLKAPQKQWKPSEKQMKALHDLNLTGNISYTGQRQVLIELYNDLKKLIIG